MYDNGCKNSQKFFLLREMTFDTTILGNEW
jgi:hypothetical protein